MTVRRGEIWIAALDPAQGLENNVLFTLGYLP